MKFLKITGALLKETLVVVQFLHVLVSVLQFCGTKHHCFYWVLSNSAPTPTHLHPLLLTPSTPTQPNYFPTNPHPHKTMPQPHSTTQNNAPYISTHNASMIVTYTKFGPLTYIYSNLSLIMR